jgi:hypothetical protein
MSATNELKVLHDQLLAEMPEGAEHEPCPLCVVETAENHDQPSGGSMPETFTQEDVDAAVAAATVDLQKRLDELGAQVQETEVGRAIAEAVAERDAKITELQDQLDAVEAARTAAESQLAETTQFWADAIAEHQQELELAAKRDERTAKAREAGVFSEDYITANADRFAAMSDDDFAARLDEWRLIASKASTAEPATPRKTALVASAPDSGAPTSRLGLIGELRAARIDPKNLGGL